MKLLRALAAAHLVLLVFAGVASADTDPAVDCFSEDVERRIEGCTALIERGD